MADETVLGGDDSARLRRRLDRERRARLEAERIAEESTRRLYRTQQEVLLLQRVATAANQATRLDDALQFAIDAVCGYTEWPVGHVYICDDPSTGELTPTALWHLDDPDRFETFRAVTEATRLSRGVGLPGRVLDTGTPAWIHDVRSDANFPRARAALDIGVRAGFAFPVLAGTEVVAVLEFFAAESMDPDASLLEAMLHIGTQIGRVAERERSLAELRRTDAMLRQSLKMEAIGRLAGGVAHDFNNLLFVINAQTDLLLRGLAPDDPGRRRAEEVGRAAARAAALTRQLLAFGRKQVLQPQIVCLNDIAEHMQNMLGVLLGEDIELVIDLDPELGDVKVDPGQTEQIIMNLAVNARDAMPRGGRLTLETSNVELDERYVRERAGLEPGPFVMLAVSDTGCGIDAAALPHVFEPFFTTKELDQGTGLGLATVYGIVKQSAGHISVYSEPGLGTTFKVYFPQVDEEEELAEPSDPGAAAGGTETILFVEDNPQVRDIATEILRQLGYTVLEAGDGEEAIRLAGEYAAPIHLLATDVIMPRVSGREVAERLATSRPAMRVLYVSGYTDGVIGQHGLLEPGFELLEKPFTPDALARKVRQLLDV